jgi:hypothetical protein
LQPKCIINLVIAHAKTKIFGGAHYGLVYCLSIQGCRCRRGRRLSWMVQYIPRRMVICMHERATSDNYRSNLWLSQKTRPAVRVGDDDNWGTNNLNTYCGKMNVKIPSDIAAGDYLLRAEALALHTARQANGAQFYLTCCTPSAP